MRIAVDLPDEAAEDFARLVARFLPTAPAPAPSPAVLTVDEAADLLRCAPKRIYELKSRGELPYVKDGGRLLLLRSDIETYLTNNRHTSR